MWPTQYSTQGVRNREKEWEGEGKDERRMNERMKKMNEIMRMAGKKPDGKALNLNRSGFLFCLHQ